MDLFMLPGNETVSEVRRDTAKPVATRPVTDYERQAFLFGPRKGERDLRSCPLRPMTQRKRAAAPKTPGTRAAYGRLRLHPA